MCHVIVVGLTIGIYGHELGILSGTVFGKLPRVSPLSSCFLAVHLQLSLVEKKVVLSVTRAKYLFGISTVQDILKFYKIDRRADFKALFYERVRNI